MNRRQVEDFESWQRTMGDKISFIERAVSAILNMFKCPECMGMGKIDGDDSIQSEQCPTCNGIGYSRSERKKKASSDNVVQRKGRGKGGRKTSTPPTE